MSGPKPLILSPIANTATDIWRLSNGYLVNCGRSSFLQRKPSGRTSSPSLKNRRPNPHPIGKGFGFYFVILQLDARVKYEHIQKAQQDIPLLNNSLYVTITLGNIKRDEVIMEGNTENGVTQATRSSIISISQLLSKVNPQDESFLKYIPDG